MNKDTLIEALLKTMKKSVKFDCYAGDHKIKVSPMLEVLKEYADESDMQALQEFIKDLP